MDSPLSRQTSRPFHISRSSAIIALGLTLLTFLTFVPVLHCGFIDFDDPEYVSHNTRVLTGLTGENIRWALTTIHAGYWQPLSWLSLMLDSSLFNPTAETFHRTNLAVHGLSAGVVFIVLSQLTGANWRSALVAAIYALHPLRVESVAWAAERKDVLSNLLAWLTIGGYAAYARQPSPRKYLLVLIPFILAILAKPMVVTLPCLLLLLDYWPLGRGGWKKLVAEKLPLFVLAIAAGARALVDQRNYEATLSFTAYPIWPRLVTMADGYVLYIWKMVWFSGLAIFYPIPGETRAFPAALATIFLIAVTIWTIAQRKHRPWLIVGWLWFVGVLLPVSGIFQAGSQSMADRFSYLPSVGLLIMLVWSIPAARTRITSAFQIGATAAVLLCLITATWIQCGYWRDTQTLFGHALAVTNDNWLAHDEIALCLSRAGDTAGAVAHWREAARINNSDPTAHYNLGLALSNDGRDDMAIVHFNQAISVRPNQWQTHSRLGVSLARLGKPQRAYDEFKRALELNPDYEPAHSGMGTLLAGLGLLDQAAAEFVIACRLDPNDHAAVNNLQRVRDFIRAKNTADIR
jgi:tetratricopeptide (TPR) repeat protein